MRPLGEGLAGLAGLLVATDDALDVVGQVSRGHTQATDGASESAGLLVLGGQAATEVYLESGGVAVEQLALETDVGGLDASAAVRAAVEVDGQRCLQRRVIREPLLELTDQRGCGVLGVHKGELAELDAGARHGCATE